MARSWDNSQKDYAILASEISKATFGMTPSEYKKHKNLSAKSGVNLRDHMTDLELNNHQNGAHIQSAIDKLEERYRGK